MEYKQLLDIIEKSQIPDIPLYMDQITTFMEENLQNHRRNDADRIITKTMINNYTKARMIPPPDKKKYSPSQLMLLIMIFHLKPVLSMFDIRNLLTSNVSNETGTKNIYDLFVKIQHLENSHLDDSVSTMSSEIEELLAEAYVIDDDDTKKLLTIFYLSLDATIKKQMAESLIDEYFSGKTKIPVKAQ